MKLVQGSRKFMFPSVIISHNIHLLLFHIPFWLVIYYVYIVIICWRMIELFRLASRNSEDFVSQCSCVSVSRGWGAKTMFSWSVWYPIPGIRLPLFSSRHSPSTLSLKLVPNFLSSTFFFLDSLETSALVVETVWAVQESGMCQISWKAVIRPPKSGEDAALLGSSVACNPIFN